MIKRRIVWILLFISVLNNAFALNEKVEASVLLPVPDNSVEIGFSDSISNAESGSNTAIFNMKEPTLDGSLNLSSEDNGNIYLYYRGIYDASSISLKLDIVRPFTWYDGTNYSEDPNDTMHFNLKVICDTGCSWDGSNKTNLEVGIELNSSSAASKVIETVLRGSSAELTMVKGIARVVVTIPSTDISDKKYGNYQAELKLTLTSNS